MNPRVLAYSFDGMGLGHLRRNLNLVGALRKRLPTAAVLSVTGSGALDRFALPEGVDVLRLPGLVKTTLGTTKSARLPIPVGDVRAVRSALIKAACLSYRPDLVLVDFYPLGRDGELREGLEVLREANPDARLVLGLRDILDSPDTVRREWHDSGHFAAAAELYDAVLVYGDPNVYDARIEYKFPSTLADKTIFTGYLGPERNQAPATCEPGVHPEIICTMGGGSDAASMAEVFVEAVASFLPEHTAMLLTGPFMSALEVQRLESIAPAGLRVTSFLADAQDWFSQASCVVSMAGYNTTCELLAAGVPTVFVPRSRPRLEQRMRATLISEITGWPVILPEHLDARALREGIAATLRMPRGESVPIWLDGCATAARVMAGLVDAVPSEVAL